MLAVLLALPFGCELLEEEGGLSTEEVVEGLKTALKVGTDSSTTALSALNGYYGDILLKIPLPPEAEALRSKINSTPELKTIFNNDLYSLDDKFEDVVLAVNRAASDAASEAAPIFKDAITGMSVSDAWEILNGTNPASAKKSAGEFDSTAATNYFKAVTSVALTDLYAPKINNSLGKPVVGTVSATSAWESVTGTYNDAYDYIDGNFITRLLISEYNLPAGINDDLGVFCTEKALNGLFYKVGEEEKEIRRDPLKWISTTVGDILKKVFGSTQD